MNAEAFKELCSDVKALHKKLDEYAKQTTQNTTDITWLKKGMFGSYFTAMAGIMYAKLFKG